MGVSRREVHVGLGSPQTRQPPPRSANAAERGGPWPAWSARLGSASQEKLQLQKRVEDVCYAGNRFGPLAVDDDEERVAASDLAVVEAADQQVSDLRQSGSMLAASLRSEIAAMDLLLGKPRGSGHSWHDMRARAVKLLAPLEAEGF